MTKQELLNALRSHLQQPDDTAELGDRLISGWRANLKRTRQRRQVVVGGVATLMAVAVVFVAVVSHGSSAAERQAPANFVEDDAAGLGSGAPGARSKGTKATPTKQTTKQTKQPRDPQKRSKKKPATPAPSKANLDERARLLRAREAALEKSRIELRKAEEDLRDREDREVEAMIRRRKLEKTKRRVEALRREGNPSKDDFRTFAELLTAPTHDRETLKKYVCSTCHRNGAQLRRLCGEVRCSTDTTSACCWSKARKTYRTGSSLLEASE